LRHPAIATLVDYGLLGTGQRFEAWSTRGRWTGSLNDAADSARAGARFLHAIGMTADPAGMLTLAGAGAPIVRPGLADAYPADPDAASAASIVVPGVRLLARASVAAIAEMLDVGNHAGPRAAALWGPAGSGLSCAVLTLARESRLCGLVPVDAAMLDSRVGPALAGRSLFVIARARGRESTRRLLHVVLRSPRAHVCLVAGRHEVPGLDGFDIGRIGADALVGAVSPLTPVNRRTAERAAHAARGMPGTFARALWRATRIVVQPRYPRGSRVAEQAAAYGGPAAGFVDNGDGRASARSAVWVPPDELAALRRRIEQAEALLTAGRHAPGLRLLRQGVAALARRQLWTGALEGATALAHHLLIRGRARDALRTLTEANEYASRDAEPAALNRAALLAGHAWIDLARLAEAECALRAALTHAGAAGDATSAARLTLALGRCLFWRGQFTEAASVIECRLPPAGSDPQDVDRFRQMARIAAAEGDAHRSLEALDEALRRVAGGTASAQADVEHTAAFVRLMLGDLDGVARAVESAIAAGRAARRPMRVLSAMLLQAEADRRRGVSLSAPRLRTLDRMIRTAPPLLRLRWELLKRMAAGRDAAGAASDLATAAGVPALTLLTPCHRSGGATSLDPIVREIVEIVHVCHDADEERVVLRQVCARIKQQLRAAAVAFLAEGGGRWDVLASEGARMDADIAARVMGANIVAAPCRIRERLEAAAPVQYGGRPIAALCARWTPGAGDELTRAAAVLSVAASAAAPIVHAALVRTMTPHVHAAPDLIGHTPAIADLRRAVERAAAAPFPVLIEGESGCGKELVARGIHRAGPRRDRRFCTMNCAALPDDLVESELFGHARGSFTGATVDRAGVFEEAHGGTLFLDEVGELSLRAQAKLLRVVQEGELRRIGENLPRRIDVRIVCATNRDLRQEAASGRFRVDLLYRLDVIRLSVPPLRERREDVAALLDHFWADATQRIGSRATLGAATRAVLGSYDWPGNVRELQNVLASLAVRSPKRGVVPAHALPPHIASAQRPDAWRLDAARRTFEEAFVRAALVRAGGQRSRAADELGLTRQGLNKLMSRLGID
jgi:DNA-binding NtrC family response regulator/tetratricopeptide (TPR) repeat protein